MGQDSKIEWTTHTLNPWLGCSKVAAGCANCYAEAFAKRTGKAKWGPGGTRVITSPDNWRKPLKWNREAEGASERPRVFCASLADVFEDWQGRIVNSRGEVQWWRNDIGVVGAGGTTINLSRGERPATMDDVRRDLFKLIDATPNLDWMLLTKRPENIRRMWPHFVRCRKCGSDSANRTMKYCGDGSDKDNEHRWEPSPRPNVWLGCSISEQETADRNVPELLKCRDLSPVLFLSAEPLLGPVDFRWKPYHHEATGETYREYLDRVGAVDEYESLKLLDLVIVGGESGGKSRPCDVEAIRSLVEQCRDANVACFVKQLGARPVLREAGVEDYRAKRDPAFEWPDGTRFGNPTKDKSLNGRVVILKDPKGGDMDEWPEDLRVRQMPAMEAIR